MALPVGSTCRAIRCGMRCGSAFLPSAAAAPLGISIGAMDNQRRVVVSRRRGAHDSRRGNRRVPGLPRNQAGVSAAVVGVPLLPRVGLT